MRDGVQIRQLSNFDRAGDNYDHEYFQLYFEENGECVIFDDYGPGTLWRHHMNIFKPRKNETETLNFTSSGDVDKNRWEGVNIRYYFDDEKIPRIDMDVSTFFSEKNPLGLFFEPFSYDGEDNYRIMYIPMHYRKRLKVALSKEPGGPGSGEMPWMGKYFEIPQRRSHWYQYTYHNYTEDPGIESGFYPEVLRKYTDVWNNIGEDPKTSASIDYRTGRVKIAGGEVKTLAYFSKKPEIGAIMSLKFKISPLTRETLFDTWLEITMDGAEKPQVNVPLGLFFNAYRSGLEINGSLLAGFHEDSTMYCYFPMPWWNSAALVLNNKGSKTIDDLEFTIGNCPSKHYAYPEPLCGYFYAVYNREFPRKEGHDYVCLDFSGRGHVVGHQIARWNTSMEENERTYIDHRLTPQIFGNGFEDDQNMGWGLHNLQKPNFGATGAKGGDGSLFRYYIPDLYLFYAHIKQGHQVYGPNSPAGHEGMYPVGDEESVTFFYAKEAVGLVLTDTLDVGNRASELNHSYHVTGVTKERKGAYWYDGEFNNVLFKFPAIVDEGVQYNGTNQFTVSLNPHNKGVKLRRRIDKQLNRQLANVYVDDRLVSERPWYSLDFEETYRQIRWYDTDFEIPAKYTNGKKEITIRIEHIKTPLNRDLNEFFYWVYCYK